MFAKAVVFVIDTSGSMRGNTLESVKNALLASLSNLDPRDSFNIIAFSGEVCLFSSSMEMATQEAILKATEWVGINLIANGGTNILLPLEQVRLIFKQFLLIVQFILIILCLIKQITYLIMVLAG